MGNFDYYRRGEPAAFMEGVVPLIAGATVLLVLPDGTVVARKVVSVVDGVVVLDGPVLGITTAAEDGSPTIAEDAVLSNMNLVPAPGA